MVTEALDALELELRQIPRVLGVGIDATHTLTVHLLTAGPPPHTMLLRTASEVVRNHTTGQVILTVSVPPAERTPAESADAPGVIGVRRAQPITKGDDSSEVTVELAHGHKVGIGRGAGSGPRAAATAALMALADVGLEVPHRLVAALRLVDWLPERQVVVVALAPVDGKPDCLGVAQGPTVDDAACFAVLNAVSRQKMPTRRLTPTGRLPE